MKRFHVHVAVPDLQQSIRFYSTLFGAQPCVVRQDYAKWMLEDPRVNFAISHREGAAGINHLGLQVDHPSELKEIQARLEAAGSGGAEEKDASCCYARSDKYWVNDPSGIAWESFHNLGTVPFYNGEAKDVGKGSCCAPGSESPARAACC